MANASEIVSYRPKTLRIRLILLRGVVRRFFLYTFNRPYVERSIARRKGECVRCGACCHLIANKCGALDLRADGSSCRLYKHYRMPNCRIFPIDERDIADRNLVAPPDRPCGFHFE